MELGQLGEGDLENQGGSQATEGDLGHRKSKREPGLPRCGTVHLPGTRPFAWEGPFAWDKTICLGGGTFRWTTLN